MVGTAGLPHVIVRFFTVKKVSDARKSAGWALLFIAILYTTAPAIAVFARTNLIETVSEKKYDDMPVWFENWEKTGLLTFTDKNNDGIIQYVADPQINELTIDRDIMVMANPEIAGLPDWVIALVVAGALAAALSTAAGLLLVISTSVAHDMMKRSFMPDISDKKELLYARLAIFVAVLIAGYFGMYPPAYVAQVVAFAFGLAAASFFPAIVLGIFWKRMNKEGAIAGMVAGFGFTAAYIIYFQFGVFDGGKSSVQGLSDQWWFGVSPEGFGSIAMIFNFLSALLVNKFTPPPPLEVQQIVENIRIPSGSSPANNH